MVTEVDEASEFTWALRHNPNCPSPYEVRMVGKGQGQIYNDKRDVVVYGKTLGKALQNALSEKKIQISDITGLKCLQNAHGRVVAFPVVNGAKHERRRTSE